MIFKVYVQETRDQVPVRERTRALYIEGESEIEVRKKLYNTPYNVEHIQLLEGAHLEYEMQDKNFKLMEI